jgi:Rrf2 family protein
MKVNKKNKLALVSLVFMATNPEKRVRVQDLSETQKISTTHFLGQIFRNLRQAGIVKSVRGPGGGYELARPTNEITVNDVLTATGEKTNSWVEGVDSNTAQARAVLNYFTSAEKKVQDEFNTTLAEICEAESNVVQFPTASKAA